MGNPLQTLPLPTVLERAALRDRVIASRFALLIQRACDVTLAGAALIVLLPMLVLIAAAVRIQSPGPAVFWQTRVGAGGRKFRIAKFRTMVTNAEEILNSHPALRAKYEANNFKLRSHEDPRITSLGRVLRALSLDELPQFWNVLRGDMSLVGARPLPEDHFQALNGAREAYVAMRPGITGLWQVSGRSDTSMDASTKAYGRTWSLWLDFRILLRTVPAVLSRRGAY